MGHKQEFKMCSNIYLHVCSYTLPLPSCPGLANLLGLGGAKKTRRAEPSQANSTVKQVIQADPRTQEEKELLNVYFAEDVIIGTAALL